EPTDLQIEILQINYLDQVLPHAFPQFAVHRSRVMVQGSWFVVHGSKQYQKDPFFVFPSEP
ncbi:MAG: hypothetical protein O6926_07125, partial [candidate division NC10 bacterium]|nr:hypothetical protein [candidate division NC10 bacterium]